MAPSKKNTPSFIAKNLLYLRKQRGLTLEALADIVKVGGKTSYLAYEQGEVLPDVFKLMVLASFYDVSVEELVRIDISVVGKREINAQLYPVLKVPVAAKAGYSASFGDADVISSLPSIMIPYKPYGISRAFEIDGNSMEPEIQNGSVVVGIKVDSLSFRDRRNYIVVTPNGVQCKEIRLNKDFIYLISKNADYPPQHISKEEILELWEVWKIMKPGET